MRSLILIGFIVAALIFAPLFRLEAAKIVLRNPTPKSTYVVGACIPLRVDLIHLSDKSVTSVRYYDGNSLIGEVTAPFRFSWTNASRGAHQLRAVAVHGRGETSSLPVPITIQDPTRPVDLTKSVDAYNINYTTLGNNARESMPLGNGDISLNTWTYENGDVGLLIGKIDALSGKANAEADACYSLRKIGRVRISLYPPIFKEAAENGKFKQTLLLSEAAVQLSAPGSELRVWVDKNHPVVRVQLRGTQKVTVTVKNDPWRTEAVAGVHLADVVFPGLTNQVAWCYHDPRTTVGYRNQHEKGVWEAGLKDAALLPQLTTVSFGALIEGAGLRSVDSLTLRSESVSECSADINILRYSKLNEATPQAWLGLMQSQAAQTRRLDREQTWKEHLQWWRNYWDRSYIHITSGLQHADVTSQYLQQRFLNACQTGPMKELWRTPFNGGTFNVDLLDLDVGRGVGITPVRSDGAGKSPMTADYRKWGASDRPQNTRHVYWPRLQTGDFDQGRAWYVWPSVVSQDWQKMVEANSPLRGAFMHTGCSGWEYLSLRLFSPRDGQIIPSQAMVEKRIVPEGVGKVNGGRSYCFDVGDEYLPYMLDYYELTQDEDFLTERLIPYAEGLFKFFDGYFTRDSKGKLVLWPAMTSEVYVRYPDTGYVPANPMGGVALLHTQLPRLLALKGKSGVTPATLALWQKVFDERPEMPKAIRRNGKLGLAPHEPDWDMEQKKTQGRDRGSLYAIWPYRAYMFQAAGTSAEDHAVASNTLELDDHGSSSWAYADYCAAILGNSERARKGVLFRVNATGQNPELKSKGYFRFPAFNYSAPNFTDWTPDQEGGNIVLSTVNYMLWNWKGKTIYLCPAWPKDWDCEFKFQGPLNTVVQGRVSSGNVILDQVVPESRRKDIVICPLQ
ncbi:MAG: DUF5703 domain-containing protein [Candidatus Methylumidiphilus sp.]